jgi:aspartyl-tRNA(Asn)/glutamyl-tRNA(Gln) amidotransferase subunit B
VAGTKVEIKNLNSFRAVQRALEYELERQREALRTGEGIVQETRGWLEREEVTVSQRTKEYAHDYRYFPEPDLPPLLVTPEQLSDLRSTMPELPGERTDRLRRQYELSAYTASVLTAEKELADYFEAAAAAGCVAPPTVAKWVTNELRGVLDEQHTGIGDARVSPAALSTLLTMLESGSISRATAKQVLAEVARSGEDPTALVEQRGLDRITSAAALEPILDQVLDENQRMVQQYRAGNVKTLQALVGQVMKRTDGRADPILTRTLLEQRLGSVAR